MKKLSIILIILFLILCTSCENNNNVKIIYHLNGGTLENPITNWDKNNSLTLEQPILDGYNFIGWFLDENYLNEPIFTLDQDTSINSSNEIHLYAKYNINTLKNNKLNSLNYNFSNQTIRISIISETYNPFSTEYIFNDKTLRQAQIKEIESAYNCKLEFVVIPNYYLNYLGTDDYISNDLTTKQYFIDNNILLHYGELNSSFYSYARMSYKNNLFAPLDNLNNNQLLTICQNLEESQYGLIANEIPTFKLLAYEERIFTELSLETPQSLWEKGLWINDKFIEYIQLLDSHYNDSIIHRIDLSEYISKLDNYQGKYVIDYENKISNFSKSIEENLNTILKFKDNSTNIIYGKSFYKANNDLNKNFGFVSFDLIELYDSFNNSSIDFNEQYSFVPYPSVNQIDDSSFNSSTYNCYFMFNNYDEETNNLSNEMLCSLLNDLAYGHQNKQKFDTDMLYNVCDNDTEKQIINQILTMKYSFDGKSVLERGKTRDHTFESYKDVFYEVIKNINEQINIKTILDDLELIIKFDVWE